MFTSGTWVSFKDIKPKPNCGILFRIINPTNHDNDPEEVEHMTFYGYMFECGYLYATFRIDDNSCMAWKVLKQYDEEDIIWFYDSIFVDKKKIKNSQTIR